MENGKRMNRKGSVFDITYVITGLTVLALVLIISAVMWNHMEPELSTQFEGVPEAQAALDAGTVSIGMFDMILVAAMIGSFMLLIILAAIIPASPIYLVGYFLYTMVMTIVGAAISNAYDQIIAADKIAATAATFTATNLIFAQLPTLIMILGAILMIITYGKLRGVAQQP